MDAPVAPAPAPRRSLPRRLLRPAAVLAGLVALYAALGFLAAPPLLRRVIVEKGSAALHRPVALERVRVNPFALSVTLSGLSVKNTDGSPFVAWDSLYVRLAPHRLLVRELGLSEVRLVRPAVRAGLAADGALTFQDLLAGKSDAAPAAPAPAQDGGGGWGLFVGRLAIEEARISFHDATRRPAFESVLGPFTIRLESFRTRGGGDSPYSFAGTTDAGETFRWTGTVATQPLRSTGKLAFERIALPRYGPYLRDVAPIALRSGLLDLGVGYELEWGPGRHVARLSGGEVVVTDLALGPAGVDDPAVKLPRIAVSGLEVDALAQEAKVAEVRLAGGTLRVLRQPDGALELMRMAPPARPEAPRKETKPWAWSVGAVAVEGAGVTWEDRVPPAPVTLALTDVAVRLEQLRPGADATWPVTASLGWPGGGKVEVKGTARPFASAAAFALDATSLDLVPLAPYLRPALAAELAAGRAGAKAKLDVDAAGVEPRWAFAGDVRLDGLSVTERGNPDLLRWKALEVNGIDAGSTPPHALVRQVRLVEPRTRVLLWEDGKTSVARALGAPAAPAAPARAAPAGRPAARQAWKTAVGAVEVVNGRATFVDRTVKPPAILDVARATARVTNLSSDPKVRSAVDVRLAVAGASPIRVTGTLNPLQSDAYTDLVVASEGVDLTPLGPYAGRYLGYGLQKGKLDLDLRYKIQSRRIASTNVVRVNQLTLGEKVDSPDATHLPVRLALALLQDTDGVILLDVPIEGSLDDPEFRLGKVIWHTILNVLTKVATSPFRALAALVGGGGDKELSLLDFAPGSAELLPDARERLATLARSLAQRPSLGLDLEGTTDEVRDGEALRRAALERALRAARKAPAGADEGAALAPEEREALLRAAYAAAFPAEAAEAAAPRGKGKDEKEKASAPTPQELEARLLERIELAPDTYATLAGERAEHARDALIEAGIDQARLFLAHGGERAGKEKGARVYFEAK